MQTSESVRNRMLVATAAGGFLAGAFFVSMVVWHFGNVIGSRAASEKWPADPPGVTARWGQLDDVGTTVADDAVEAAALISSTTGVLPLAVAIREDLRSRALTLPVKGIERKHLVESFTDARGGSRLHEAIDILAPRNTPVLAVESGKIARLFLSKLGGIAVYQLDPTEKYIYYYAHLERYADDLREGASVSRGDVIGYVGTSGNAPPQTPHLHFAIFRLTELKHWWEGTPVDPYSILK